MKWQGEELQRVRSESELRAGMTVICKCSVCERIHAKVFLRSRLSPNCKAHGIGRCRTWDAAPRFHCLDQNVWWCVQKNISEGRLYRLRDDDKADEQTRTRELEHQR